ncbi:Spy/CpxP family protein refolding chaperone [Sulfurivermis fontis]|uniref:Spy/CpxP family protein refolding chaperone n=1 Tax=Sulfurivermis fontis TaxID=1972068 RepID=UPI000FD8BEE1|nr:periplasmic heavy metal sensor [Sulfurivermis fontis]
MQRLTEWRWSMPLFLTAVLVMGVAQAADPRPAYGPGMMGGYGMGPGMMGGYGMGPGMMGGYGPGLMYDGGDGYGPGMMGGWGMGPGMMGGYGLGPGMGMGPIWALDLNENQRRAIDNIMAEQHKQHWAAMSAMIAAQGRLRELQMAEQWDEKAISGVYDDIYKQQRAMIEAMVRARNRIYDQLSAEQKAQLRRWSWGGRWGR